MDKIVILRCVARDMYKIKDIPQFGCCEYDNATEAEKGHDALTQWVDTSGFKYHMRSDVRRSDNTFKWCVRFLILPSVAEEKNLSPTG